MSDELDRFFAETTPQGRGCAACGEKTEVQVMVQARDLRKGHKGNIKGHTNARSRAFCGRCGLAMVEKLREELTTGYSE